MNNKSMQKTYEIIEQDGKEMLIEEAIIPKPKVSDFGTPPLGGFTSNQFSEYTAAVRAYDEHISLLKVYPISGYIGQAGTKGLVENVHFYLKDQFTKPTADRKALIREIVAHPIAQDEKAFSKSPTSINWSTDEQIEKMAEEYSIEEWGEDHRFIRWKEYCKGDFIAGAKAIIAVLNK